MTMKVQVERFGVPAQRMTEYAFRDFRYDTPRPQLVEKPKVTVCRCATIISPKGKPKTFCPNRVVFRLDGKFQCQPCNDKWWESHFVEDHVVERVYPGDYVRNGRVRKKKAKVDDED